MTEDRPAQQEESDSNPSSPASDLWMYCSYLAGTVNVRSAGSGNKGLRHRPCVVTLQPNLIDNASIEHRMVTIKLVAATPPGANPLSFEDYKGFRRKGHFLRP